MQVAKGEGDDFEGILLPTYYVSCGYNSRNDTSGNAVHCVFNTSLSETFDEGRMDRGEAAVSDDVGLSFWRSRRQGCSVSKAAPAPAIHRAGGHGGSVRNRGVYEWPLSKRS